MAMLRWQPEQHHERMDGLDELDEQVRLPPQAERGKLGAILIANCPAIPGHRSGEFNM